MTLGNMNRREVKFWAKGCRDTLRAIAKNGLWRCPCCFGLMAWAPVAYSICPICEREFGVDAPSHKFAWPIWNNDDIKPF